MLDTKYESVFQISPLVRVVAIRDTWQQPLSEYAKSYSIHLETIQCARGVGKYYGANTIHTPAIQTVIGECLYKGDFSGATAKLAKYFDNFNLYAHRSPDDHPHAYLFHTLKGYGQGEWNEVIMYSNELSQPELEAMVTELDTYYKGEVYEVYVEHAKVFTATDGEELLKWEQDEDYDTNQVVQEFFTLTADYIYDTYRLEVLPEVEG